MLHSGKLGFGDVYLEHLLDTTCIYAQNVSTAQTNQIKIKIWGGFLFDKNILMKM